MSTSGPTKIRRRRRLRALAGAVLVTGLLLIFGAPDASAQVTKAPPEPVLLGPIGPTSLDPIYWWQTAGSWATGDQANYYRIWVQSEFDVPGKDRIVRNVEVPWGPYCTQQDMGECRIQLGALDAGPHTFYVQARNNVGIGFWSGGLGFQAA